MWRRLFCAWRLWRFLCRRDAYMIEFERWAECNRDEYTRQLAHVEHANERVGTTP